MSKKVKHNLINIKALGEDGDVTISTDYKNVTPTVDRGFMLGAANLWNGASKSDSPVFITALINLVIHILASAIFDYPDDFIKNVHKMIDEHADFADKHTVSRRK